MKKIFDQLNERGKNYSKQFEYEDECIKNSEEAAISTQFFANSEKSSHRFKSTLPVFGYNSGRYDLKLINSYVIPYLIRDKEETTSAIKKRTISFSSSLEMYKLST